MERKRTTFYIDSDIIKFCKENKINMSEWFSTEFKNKFFGVNAKVIELEQIKQREAEIKKEIQEIKERVSSQKLQLTDREKRFIYSIPERLKTGKDLKAIHNFFNYEYNRNLPFDDFLIMYKQHAKVAQDRYEYARSKKRRKA